MEPQKKILHIHGSDPEGEQTKKLESIRKAFVATEEYQRNQKEADKYFSEAVLHRFCCARNYDHKKSLKLLQKHCLWEFEVYRPFEIRAKEMKDLELPKYGSIQVSPRGPDGFQRPIIILDDTKDNTNIQDAKGKQRAQMRHLAFNMERASRLLKNGVNRWVVFISLEDFSLFGSPSIATTKETIDILTCQYPERLGVCVLYKAPWLFTKFWNAVLPFVDKVTRNKVVFISGDTSEGSKNDIKLKSILGDNWRHVCGQDEPKYDPKASRGYKYAEYWEQVVKDELEYLNKQKDSVATPN